MLEYEKKIMLTKDEYLAIFMLMCNNVPIQTQTNYYFDDDDLSMNKKGVTCRIRAKDGKYKATVKNHNVEHLDCSVEVDLVEKSTFDPLIFNAFGLCYKGELVTNRVIIYKDSTCEMVLDRNIYLGYMDFELEVEYCKESEDRAKTLIENIGKCLVAAEQLTRIDELISRVGKESSKSQRFFERLKFGGLQKEGVFI